MREEEVEVLLRASTDMDGSITELLFTNPTDEDVLVNCANELLFETCGRYDDVIVEFSKKDLDVAFMDGETFDDVMSEE